MHIEDLTILIHQLVDKSVSPIDFTEAVETSEGKGNPWCKLPFFWRWHRVFSHNFEEIYFTWRVFLVKKLGSKRWWFPPSCSQRRFVGLWTCILISWLVVESTNPWMKKYANLVKNWEILKPQFSVGENSNKYLSCHHLDKCTLFVQYCEWLIVGWWSLAPSDFFWCPKIIVFGEIVEPQKRLWKPPPTG